MTSNRERESDRYRLRDSDRDLERDRYRDRNRDRDQERDRYRDNDRDWCRDRDRDRDRDRCQDRDRRQDRERKVTHEGHRNLNREGVWTGKTKTVIVQYTEFNELTEGAWEEATISNPGLKTRISRFTSFFAVIVEALQKLTFYRCV